VNNNSPYQFERLSDDNIHHLCTLFSRVFKKNLFVADVLKKYNTRHLGVQYLGHMALMNGKPIAYGGFIPFRLGYQHQTELGAQSVDSMAVNEAKGTGVFTHIYHLNEFLLKSSGIRFGYGFANQSSYPVFVNKFGWVSNRYMHSFVVPVKKALLNAGLKRVGGFDISKKFKEEFGHLVINEPISQPFNDGQHGYTTYDKDYFRYKSDPMHYFIRVENAEVWIKLGNILSVGHFTLSSPDQLPLIMDQLGRICIKTGMTKIFFQFSENSMHATALSKFYQPIIGTAICFKNFTGLIPQDKILFSNADTDTF